MHIKTIYMYSSKDHLAVESYSFSKNTLKLHIFQLYMYRYPTEEWVRSNHAVNIVSDDMLTRYIMDGSSFSARKTVRSSPCKEKKIKGDRGGGRLFSIYSYLLQLDQTLWISDPGNFLLKTREIHIKLQLNFAILQVCSATMQPHTYVHT